MTTSGSAPGPATAALLRLTDEELQLFGAADDVDTPYLDRLEADQRVVAADVAYRALCAHGVAVQAGEGLLVPDELVHLLQVRAHPEHSYRMEVRSDGVRVLRYVYEAGGVTVCEDISNDGVHDFDVLASGCSEQLMLAALAPDVPLPAGGASTAAQLVDLPGLLAVPAPWGHPLATADVTGCAADGEAVTVSVIWGDAGTYVVSPVPYLQWRTTPGWCRAVAAHLGIREAS